MLLSHGSTRCCLTATAHHASSDTPRHSKGDVKGAVLGILGRSTRPAAAAALFFSAAATSAPGRRHSALSAAGDGASASSSSSPPSATATDASLAAAATDASLAAAAAAAAADTDWEAVRTAASILSLSTDGDPDSSSLSSYSSSATTLQSSDSLSAETTTAAADSAEPLIVLDAMQTLDADSLALAVGILRQHQPIDAQEDSVQLSERLRDFLQVLQRRPAARGSSNNSTTATEPAAAATASTPAPTAAADEELDGFWSGQDEEWGDVRSALMSIGINASLDEDDWDTDEHVWDLEAGRVKTRRTRLLRSLPRLDTITAQQLTAFLADLQEHTTTVNTISTTTSVGGSSGQDGGAPATLSEEEEQWWKQAQLAYSLLKEQAGKVKQGVVQAEEGQQAAV